MKVLRNTLLMIVGAVLLFFAFAHIDEYDRLIAPLLEEEKQENPDASIKVYSEEEIRAFLLSFNEALYSTYRSLDPAMAKSLPATDRVQRVVFDEVLYFMQNEGGPDLSLERLSVEKISRPSPGSYRVTVREQNIARGGSEGKDDQGGGSVTSESRVSYLLVSDEKGLKVDSFDDVSFAGDGGAGVRR